MYTHGNIYSSWKENQFKISDRTKHLNVYLYFILVFFKIDVIILECYVFVLLRFVIIFKTTWKTKSFFPLQPFPHHNLFASKYIIF